MKKKNNKKPDLKLDFGIFLLVTGALANITLWIGAFVSTETQGVVSIWIREYAMPVLGSISGLAMGITAALGLVYVLSRLGKMRPTIETKVRGKDEYRSSPNYRFYGALVSIILLLIISPALLSPFVLMLIADSKTLYNVLGTEWAGLWSVGRVVAADLALGAIALVHGVQFGAVAGVGGATGKTNTATQSDGATKSTPKNKPGTAKDMRVCEYGCGMSYRWPQGKGAHIKKHHRDRVVPKGIPVDVTYTKVEK